MAKQIINIGSTPNDGTGDTIRVAGNKINENFTEIYTGLASIQPYTLPTATTTTLGGVKVDNSTITINNGIISAASTGGSYTLPTATTTQLGGVKIDGTTITINGNGVISVPTASTTQLGGVKIDGTTITISGGVIKTNTVTATGDPTYSNNTTTAASTGWIRSAMSNIMSGLGFAYGYNPNDYYGGPSFYMKLPSCLGGFKIAAGGAEFGTGDVCSTPIQFESAVRVITVPVPAATGTVYAVGNDGIPSEYNSKGPYTGFIVRHNAPGVLGIQYIAFGV
jgi:hypothetical protein